MHTQLHNEGKLHVYVIIVGDRKGAYHSRWNTPGHRCRSVLQSRLLTHRLGQQSPLEMKY